MNKREIKSIIESLLFVWGEPLEIKDISRIIDVEKKIVEESINELIDEQEHYRRGIVLEIVNKKVQLTTRPEHDEYISGLIKTKKKKLSNSSMEVLAIIAYNQPITRVQIDNIRGVKSYSAIDNLKSKDLIEEVGKLDVVGKPILYGTTDKFLTSFNLTSLNDLPEIENLENVQKEMEEFYEDQ